MSTFRKVLDEDGTYSISTAEGSLRTSLTGADADDVLAMLSGMDASEED